MGHERHNSYHQYMKDRLFQHLDIPDRQTHLPKGDADDIEAECHRYESLISKPDGVD